MRDKKYYVYTLAYPDGTVFYVGKGTGDRIKHHEMEARRGVMSKKCRTIRAIWNAGEQVKKSKVFETSDQDMALRYELALIMLMNASEMLTNYAHTSCTINYFPKLKRGAKWGNEVVETEDETYYNLWNVCRFAQIGSYGTGPLFLFDEYGLSKFVGANVTYYRLSELQGFSNWIDRTHPEMRNIRCRH